MQAESAGAEGKRQNLYYLPEVQERIHQKKLIWQGKGELGMFGYININQKIMTEENRKAYQAYYCGLCQRLKSNCGAKGQMLLNYDMTFLNPPRLHARCIRPGSDRCGSMRRQIMRRI